MSDLGSDPSLGIVKVLGSTAGAAMSLIYFLPQTGREAAGRFLTGVSCGLIFGGPTGLWLVERLGIGGELSGAEVMLAGSAAASLCAWWALGVLARLADRYGTRRHRETVTAAFDEFMEAFEAFKEVNDRRLGEIEQKLTADVVTRDKMDRINRAMDDQKKVLDQLVLKRARPQLGSGSGIGGGRGAELPPEAVEHKAAFDAYIRRGEETGLRELEAKAFLPARAPMAATWCRRKRTRRSAGGSPSCRRCGRCRPCGPYRPRC